MILFKNNISAMLVPILTVNFWKKITLYIYLVIVIFINGP